MLPRLTGIPDFGMVVRPVNVLIFPLCIWLLGGIFCCKAAAEIITARSSSGQFVAREIQAFAYPTTPANAVRTKMANGWGFLLVSQKNPSDTDESSIRLEPSLLVVSCERLKEMFLVEMGLEDQWKGSVALMINPALDQEKRPKLTLNYSTDGWSYNLELPKTISTRLLVHALMDTLILEMANRNAGSQCAEVPFWLVEGMSAHLQSFNLPTFLLQPSAQMAGNRVKLEGLDKVREELRRHSPLSFQQLSWPTEADADGDSSELYRSCAQLFVEQLLQFKDGNRLLGEMLRQLPEYHNWQTAFLSAFRPHFQQLLDVEKWWGLSYVDFTRTDLAEPLTAADCWRELQDALDVPAQVHFQAEHMPAEAKFTLQEVIEKWSPDDSARALDRSINALRLLRVRASRENRPLVDQYLKTVTGYSSSSRDPRLEWAVGNNHPSALRILKSDAIKELDSLDQQRSAMQRQLRDSISTSQLSIVGDAK
jgi:hypothetical protein